MAIAERWMPKPMVLESAAGAHRFVWDLRWAAPAAMTRSRKTKASARPTGRVVVPGTYQVKLTVDGNAFTQPLKIEMDPRSDITHAELDEQLRLGLEIFGEVRSSAQGAGRNRRGEEAPGGGEAEARRQRMPRFWLR